MLVGIDVLEIERIKDIKNLEKIFLPSEIEYINKFSAKEERICGFFCAKEAVFKSLNLKKINFLDIEISHDQNSRPFVIFHGETKAYFDRDFSNIDISISHSKTVATAIAIASLKK